MKIKSLRLLAAAALTTAGLAAQAAVVPTSITPRDKSTVESITAATGIKLVYDYEVYYGTGYIAPEIQVTNANGASVCKAIVNYTGGWLPDYSGVEESMTIKPAKDITADGTYFFTIPKGTIKNTDTNETNDQMVLTYTIGESTTPGGGDEEKKLEYTFEFVKTSVSINGGNKTYDFNATGRGAIANLFAYWKERPSNNPSVMPYLEDASGNRTFATKFTTSSATSTTYYNFIYFDKEVTKLFKTGDYAFVIPEGFAGTEEWMNSGFTSGSCNAEVRIPFKYIQDENLVVAEEPTEVTLTKFGFYDGDTCLIDYLANPETSPNITGSDTTRILVASDKNAISNDIKVDIYDETIGEWMWGTNTFTQQVTSETDIITINGKNADGEYEIEFSNPRFTLEFLQGHEYSIKIAFYQKYDGVRDDELVCYGTAEARFTGTTKVFEYSDVEIVSVEPAEGSEFTDADAAEMTVTFTKPVTMGGSVMDVFKLAGYTSVTSNADGTVWTLKADPNAISDATGTADFRFSAKDAEGRPVRSEKYYTSGQKENTYITVSYYCYLGGGEIVSDPADGAEVMSLYEFKFTAPYADKQNIGFLGMNAAGKITTGELKDADGNVVATLDRTDVKEPGTGETNTKSTIHLDSEITKPGVYTLHLPGAYFMTGTESLSVASKPTTFTFTIPGGTEPDPIITDYVVVKFSIGGYAGIGYKTKKEHDLEVEIESEDFWALDTLTLDGVDVTDNVVDGTYTIPAAELKENANLIATYKFAKTIDFDFSTGVNEISGCEYKIYTDGEELSIDNLKTGDVVRIYSLNGMEVFNKTATDTFISVALAPGQYIILINDTALKVMK